MPQSFPILVSLALMAAGPSSLMAVIVQDPAVTPAPSRLVSGSGSFRIGPATRIAVSHPAFGPLRDLAEYFAVPLRAATGFEIPVLSDVPSATAPDLIVLALTTEPTGAARRPYDRADGIPENYSLDAEPGRILIEAPATVGLFRGLQTLRQLMPPAFEDGYAATHGQAWRSDEAAVAGANRSSNSAPPREPVPQTPAATPPRTDADWTIPAVSIEDAPRFSWRGMHLDVGRHYFPPSFIRKYIDLIASQRMNVFHWHLTEDQGWRMEIAKYPRLTEVGAFRKETILERNFNPYVGDGVPYGGFYTQDEIREMVEYAASRYVTIVPEIELPGHSTAALAAYPELGCTSGPFEVSTVWGVKADIYCPYERTFDFLEDVFTEVLDLFPGRYVHIGGDEAPKTAWERSEFAQNLIREQGLADEHGLQSWFIRRIERFLNDNGRQLIGWDEILEGGLAPEATVMSWRGMQGGIDAALQGHDVVMTPTSHVYFDYYQGAPENEPLAIGGFVPLRHVYSFEPVPPDLDGSDARHVLGTQGNVWTEYIRTADHVEYMAVPRIIALAEVAWSPKEARDWNAFLERLPATLERMHRLGVDFRVPDVAGLEADRLTLADTVRITLAAPVRGAVIHFTLDGSDPTTTSAVYRSPFDLPLPATGVTVSARALMPDGRVSAISRAHFEKTTLRTPDLRDRTGLEDGLRYSYFEGTYGSADAVRDLQPVRNAITSAVSLQGGERDERFALRFLGYVNAAVDGIYTFTLSSDDGSRLRVGDRLVIDHDGPHGTSARTGQIALGAGWHSIEVTYYQAGGGRSLDLEMALEGEPSARAPSNAFAHRPTG